MRVRLKGLAGLAFVILLLDTGCTQPARTAGPANAGAPAGTISVERRKAVSDTLGQRLDMMVPATVGR